MSLNSVSKFIISLSACFAAAGIGSVVTSRAIPDWYARLEKPTFTPPGKVFGPVWTTLYTMMGISVFLIWQRGLYLDGALLAFVLFWVQLAANTLWSIVFFGMKSTGRGVVTISILWLLILATTITSFRVSKLAGALLVPYILWVSVASYLNAGIWRLNRPERQAALL